LRHISEADGWLDWRMGRGTQMRRFRAAPVIAVNGRP
jgi:hypothetical protein